ncbi:MAG TPA: DNA methyltransferase, partial [Thermoplasmata archaeon]|nr:DNA methyltransferase [Thermoplasmata archaeon]
MPPVGSGPPAGDAPVLAALKETGAIGSTVRQIAGRIARPESQVARTLVTLSETGRVVRIGRGLWILRAFERLDGRTDFAGPAEYVRAFEEEFGAKVGRYRGPITFTANDAAPVHRWWPYVQGYSAEFVRTVLASHPIPAGATVLDPFAGSGTTLVEARRAGFAAVGVELLPPAALAARVKTRFEVDPRRLADAARRVVAAARDGPRARMPFLRETRRQFSPRSLDALRRLRAALPDGDGPIDEALRLAFGRILIPASRLRRSPCLGYGRPPGTEEPDVLDAFRRAVATMAEDLDELQRDRASWGPPARVVAGDARALDLAEGSVALAVTSPPYVNGMDYVMNYKIDLAWLGYATSYDDLARFRAASVACDNLPRAELLPFLDPATAADPALVPILTAIADGVSRKGTYRRDDVHAVVARYFHDLVPVLRAVHRALVPGGRFVLVVGDSLLAGTYVPG